MAPELVIFDCDGVLVDSEAIALDVMRDVLAELGLALDPGTVRRRFLGRSLPAIVADLAADGLDFDLDAGAAMDATLRRRFEAELTAMPGIPALLDRLAVPACVASSAHAARLHHALRTAGLYERFAGTIFSADEVRRGKPHPDLFLHAAARMGVAPVACLVVEDSPPGLAAARAAGMRAVAFAGGTHIRGEGDAFAGHEGAIARDAAELARHLPLRPA